MIGIDGSNAQCYGLNAGIRYHAFRYFIVVGRVGRIEIPRSAKVLNRRKSSHALQY
jgi:hypothetical protein